VFGLPITTSLGETQMSNRNKPNQPASRNKQRTPAKNTTARPTPLPKPTKAPAAQGRVMRTAKPQMRSLPNGDIVVSHREFIKDIPGSVGFAVSGLPVSPGRNVTFPWLGQIAPNFESYLFKRLKFEFLTSSPTSAGGKMMIMLDYDAVDADPSNKQEVMAQRNACSCSTWESMTHTSLYEDLTKRKTYFVRTTPSTPTSTRQSDCAFAYFATQGQADTSLIGEMYVEYEVLLMTPNLEDLGVGGSYSMVRTGTSATTAFQTLTRGNLQATVLNVNTAGVQVVSTFTFLQPFTGTFAMIEIGTGLSYTFGGTAAQLGEVDGIQNAALTKQISVLRVQAEVGQTLIFTTLYTTLTTAQAWAMQGAAY